MRNEEGAINEPCTVNEEEQIKTVAKKSEIHHGFKNKSQGRNKK